MPTRKGKRIALAAGLVLVAVLAVTAGLCWPHVRFHWLFESLGPNDQSYPEYRHRQTGIVFVGLPGGKFLMGSPEDDVGRDDNEGPRHEVELSPFLIAKYAPPWRYPLGRLRPVHLGADRMLVPLKTVH